MNIIKTIKTAAAGALMYAAATLGIGCSTIPMYDTTNDTSLVRFENKQDLTDKLDCWSRIDIKSGEDPQDMEGFFAKIMPEYKLGKGFGIAAQYLAVQGEDIVRAGIAYGKKFGADKIAKVRVMFPANDSSNTEIDALFCYDGKNFQGSALLLYFPEDGSMHSELTAKFGQGNIKPLIQITESGPIDDLEGKILLGFELTPKKEEN